MVCQQNHVGLVTTPELLDVVPAFTMETNFTVWGDLLASLAEIGRLLQYTDAGDDFKSFICNLLGTLHADLGWGSPEKKEGE